MLHLTNIEKILESLSPEKRALLENKLKKEGSKYGVFPLSYAQQRLWFIEELQPGNTAYNIPSALKLKGKLNFNALKKSLEKIIQRHEILRTYISVIGETPLQIVEKQFDMELEIIDLKEINENQKESKIKKILNDRVNKPFSLSELPLFRIILLSLSETENIMLLVMHHIVSDGWSAGVFINELSNFYLAYSNGNEPTLPPLEIQYADFAKWQKKWLQEKIKDEQLSFWKKQLEDVPVLELPYDFNRPKVQTFNGGLVKGEFDKSIAEKLKNISQEEGATLFMSLLAIFNILLYKHSGQTDFAVGTPIANRNNQQTENLIGFFVNTLALRSQIEPGLSFREYIRKFKNTVLSAYSNQDLPFEMIIEELQPERDMSRSPIFQVMFTFQNKSNFELKLNDIQLSPVKLEASVSKFDLSLNISEMNDGRMLIGLEYNKDLFTEESVLRIYKHLQNLTSKIVENSDIKIKDADILTKDENLLLAKWNETDKEKLFEKNIIEHFEEQVKSNPNSVALEFGDKQLTYIEFNERINQLANYLTENNVNKNSFVALLFERSFEMVISIYAVNKSGAAYLPIAPEQPSERINYIIEDANVDIVLTHKNFDKNIINENIKVINVDLHKEKIDKESKEYKSEILIKNLAYCIYTSGSTGKPKGTLLHHKGLSNRIIWMKEKLKTNQREIFIQKTPYTFDVSVWEFFLPLTIGAKLVIAKPEGHKDPFYLKEIITEKNVTIIHFVPSMLKVFLETPDIEKCKSLRNVVCSGEALSVNLQNKFFRLFTSSLYNFYGPTEATVDVTYWESDNSLNLQYVPIGKAIANTKIYVLDNFLNPLPVGVAGELYIAGVNLAYGYLNKPDLTAEKFIPNPFSEKPGERLYKTGDLVKTLPDGNIVFLNRIDNQVKLRGLRIELGEIEFVLKNIDFIKDALVSVYKENQNEFLVAYVITNYNAENKTEKIKNVISKTLPDYMVPATFIYLEEFPLTSSGKINRKVLPLPNETEERKEKIIVKPETKTEEILIETISHLLNLKEVSTLDNFFSIGGHSLLATQLIIRVKKKFSIDIPLKSIFENPTIKDFAKIIDNYLKNDKPVGEEKIPTVPRTNKLQLSYQQQRLWFLDQLDPMNASYNIPSLVKLKGEINLEIVAETINIIISRQEILRSYIQTNEGKPSVKIVDVKEFNIDLVDVTNKNKNEVYEICKNDVIIPFSLNKFPLFRIKLYRVNEKEHYLLFVIHHIISDGWSESIFIKEFTEIYSSLLFDKTPQLPELKIQYADFANWQREYLNDSVLEEKLEFWRNYLKEVPALLQLPTDKPRPAIQTFNGEIINFKVPENLTKQIKTLSKNENATLFMVLLGAFQTLLAYYSGQDDIVVGTPVANRNKEELENLIGFFVNTVVFRNDFSNNPTFKEILKRIIKISAQVFSHQDLPFEKLVDSLNIERNVSHSPLFQVMFTFQNLPQTKISLPRLDLESVELGTNIAKFDLSLTMMESVGEQLVGGFEFNTDLFERKTIERMVQHFLNLLNIISKSPEVNIKNINILTDTEKTKILNEWKGSTKEYKSISNLAKAFYNASEKYSEEIAVKYDDSKITYAELNSITNKIANYLIQNGVLKESFVGFYLDRSIESIISIISIWKAGAAYVPLDPSYPKERIDFMINDSAMKIIITIKKYKELFDEQKLFLIDSATEIKNYKDVFPEIEIKPENLAYIIYTSGSTGKPKGVMVQHKSVLNLAAALMDIVYSKSNSRKLTVSLNAPLAFDASVQQLVALLYGHTLCIIPQDIRLDGEGLMNFIRDEKIDVLDCVPTQLSILLENGFAETNKWKPSLVLPGGEPIDNDMWNNLLKIREVKFFNMYGPTECTVDSTICEIKNEISKPSIGLPIYNTTHFILDKQMNPVPIGIAGELYIGGESLTRGYLNRTDLTAERFLPNPFSENEGERIYKTGDLVRYLLDGNIEYVGRVDNQVKLRGFRIELGEIEALLNKHNDISKAVVIIREDKPSTKKIVAYYVSGNANLENKELAEYLSGTLPEYMIPSFFVKLKNIPLTPNGKIDRKALPAPTVEDISTKEEYIEPQTGKEKLLAEVWQELLGFEKIGLNDNFFKLGGDSIVAIQMIAKAKQKGLKITPVQIFQNQTLQKLAFAAKETTIVDAEQGLVQGIAPLTPIQHYFFEKKFANYNHWNQSVFLKVNELLDESKLREAVKTLILHHDELRAAFEHIENTWQQNISGELHDVPFEFVDFSSLDSENLKQSIEEYNNKTQASLDIKKGKLIKVVYYKTANNNSRILIVVHHLAIDGVSWRIIIEDLITAYNMLIQNKEIVLPSKTTSYISWANFINRYALEYNFENEKKYWLNQAEKNIIKIDTDFNSHENLEGNSFSANIFFTKEDTNYFLKDIHEKYNTQINDILLTALLLAYNKWKGKRELLIHLEGHGREQLSEEYDISRTVGWFTSLYPLHLSMYDEINIGEIIKSVKEDYRRVPNKGIDFGILRYLTNDNELKTKLSVFDDVQIMFNYLGQFDQSVPENTPFEMAMEAKGKERNVTNKRTSLLEVTSIVTKGVMSLSIGANKNQFKKESIEEFLTDIKTALLEIAEHCKENNYTEYTPSDFDLIDLEDDRLSSMLDKLNNEDE